MAPCAHELQHHDGCKQQMDIKLAKWQWDFYNTSKYLSFTDSNKERGGRKKQGNLGGTIAS